jgi:hypothetical protein
MKKNPVLAKMNDDYEDFKGRSEADYEIILGIAKRGLASLKLEHDDRDSLERAIYFLERSFRALAWISDQSKHGKLARQALCEIMGAAFLVGAVGAYTDSAVLHFRLHFRADQAKRARNVKVTKDAARTAALDKAVAEAAKRLNRFPAMSEKFASLIRGEIAEKLGYPLGKSAIIESVRRIRASGSLRTNLTETGS